MDDCNEFASTPFELIIMFGLLIFLTLALFLDDAVGGLRLLLVGGLLLIALKLDDRVLR